MVIFVHSLILEDIVGDTPDDTAILWTIRRKIRRYAGRYAGRYEGGAKKINNNRGDIYLFLTLSCQYKAWHLFLLTLQVGL